MARLLPAAVLCWLVMPAALHAGFVRGAIKVDVRDSAGRTVAAAVRIHSDVGGEAKTAQKVGDVYVVDGLVEGEWIVEVEGAPSQKVHVEGHQTIGVVFVLGQGRNKTLQFARSPNQIDCTFDGGIVVEAVVFYHDALAAGRLEVKRRGKLLCSTIVAGGGASLRLVPGEYSVEARVVGGRGVQIPYRLTAGRPAPPLLLRVK